MEGLAWPSHSCTLAMSTSFDSVCRGRCPHRMHTNTYGFAADAGRLCVLHNDGLIDRPRVEVPFERAGAIVRHGPEEGRVQAFMPHRPAVLPRFEILADRILSRLPLMRKCMTPWRLCTSRRRSATVPHGGHRDRAGWQGSRVPSHPSACPGQAPPAGAAPARHRVPACFLHFCWRPAALRRPRDYRRRHCVRRDSRTAMTAPRACGGCSSEQDGAIPYSCARRSRATGRRPGAI